ncbi:hypothetical protein Anas_07653 [Armadillidium nasatum]|uniref:Uncharacterized protein n=1 Tax=Armadillidium nasatum TaxID=96803 RepID=A0A5N5SWH4_9CRUS|nr:hypothetical protein Anas_07653 [Armadillidium nasatum]
MDEVLKKVSTLHRRIDKFEDKIHFQFQILSEAIADEKVSLENIHSRLDSLDFLTIKVEEVKSKFENESSVIRNRVAERLEILEKSTVENQDRDSESIPKKNVKKEAIVERHTRGMKSNTTISVEEQNDIQVKDGEKETGEVMLQTVENVMSRLLAAELNHFYLNMATKTDYSMKHLETLLASKLRKIEMLAKNSLLEIKDGRQDMSHVTHLQRTIIDKFPRQLLRQNSSCEVDF